MRANVIVGTLFSLSAILGIAAPAAAQQQSAGDIAFSYSVLHDSDVEETLPKGWLFAGGYNLGDHVAVLGEVGGNYKSIDVLGSDLSLRVHSFLGGMRFQNRRAKAMPFGQVLVGLARSGATFLDESDAQNGLAIQPGGGVDIALTSALGARVQGDYRMIRADGATGNEFRFAFGLVFGLSK